MEQFHKIGYFESTFNQLVKNAKLAWFLFNFEEFQGQVFSTDFEKLKLLFCLKGNLEILKADFAVAQKRVFCQLTNSKKWECIRIFMKIGRT